MIELTSLDEDISIDIKYATSENFLGRPVYDRACAFLQESAASSLLAAHRDLKNYGFGVVVFDGYRPWSVTKVFWDSVKPEEKKYVADPEVGSRHNRGCAVDLSLYYLDSGTQAEMPSDFDEFNEKAHPEYRGGSDLERQNRDLLIEIFESNAFKVNPNEWWHFDHHDWADYPIMDVSFDALTKQTNQL